jgi:hypothetical protein
MRTVASVTRKEAEATDENARNAFPTRHNTSPAPEFHEIALIFWAASEREMASDIDAAEFGNESIAIGGVA